MKSSKIYNIFLVLIGVVVGTFVSSLCKDVKTLSWLSYGAVFGMDAPLELKLGVVDFTFGININLTLATIIFIILALLIGRRVVR